MWKVFKAELKHLFSKPVRIVEYIIMLFIPFVYGFLYMNAYWAPFKHVDKLPIVILNNDKGFAISGSTKVEAGEKLVKDVKQRDIHAGNQIYTINVNPAPSIYSKDDAGEKKLQEAVNSGKYSAAIVIPSTFSESLTNFKKSSGIEKLEDFLKNTLDDNTLNGILAFIKGEKNFVINDLISASSQLITNPTQASEFVNDLKSINFLNLLKEFSSYFGESHEENNIRFYNDYKNSYLAGEMTNFGAGLIDILMQISFSQSDTSIGSQITSAIYDSVKKFIADHADESSVIEYKPIGSNIDTYGKGLSPYFISIALFAGALTMTFLIKNERHKGMEGVPTAKHYFGKWLVWLLTGWAQAVILLTAITLQGVNIGMNQYQIFLWGFFVSAVFSTIVQAVVFSIRYGDIGEFTVVIILVLQLISSSGTFPVEMQNIIFKIIHPIAPFTYSINGFREMLYSPDVITIFENLFILLVFPAVLVPTSLFINHLFDKKHCTLIEGMKQYKSFEINVGDL